MRLTFWLMAYFIIGMPVSAYAEYCPKVISLISGDVLAKEAQKNMKDVYGRLGCEVTFKAFPTKRSLLYFNEGFVDGEIYRSRLIEKSYANDYVRSSVPLFTIQNGLWLHPQSEQARMKPLGWVRGIKWHEDYLATHETASLKTVAFDAEDKMYDAYERGAIGSFLTEKSTLELLNKREFFAFAPFLEEVVSTLPVYHYLQSDYAKFMEDFSQEIETDNPFKN